MLGELLGEMMDHLNRASEFKTVQNVCALSSFVENVHTQLRNKYRIP